MKRTNQFLLVLMTPVLLIAVSCATMKSTTGKQDPELAYKVATGQSFTLKSEGTTQIKSEQMGQEVTIDMKSTSETLYTALKTNPDGSIRLQLEYKSMNQSTETPNGVNEADYSSWLGKKAQFDVSSNGKLSGFAGFDELPAISAATGEKVTGEMVKKGMNDIFFELPDHPIKIGETWTAKTSNEIPYGANILKQEETTTYTATEKVKKNGFDCIKIVTSGVQKITGELEQQGMSMTLTRDTQTSGIVYFSLKQGMYISAEGTSTAKGEVDIPSAGMVIPQEITSKLSVTVIFN